MAIVTQRMSKKNRFIITNFKNKSMKNIRIYFYCFFLILLMSCTSTNNSVQVKKFISHINVFDCNNITSNQNNDVNAAYLSHSFRSSELFWGMILEKQVAVIDRFVMEFTSNSACKNINIMLTEPDIFIPQHYIDPYNNLSKNTLPNEKIYKSLIKSINSLTLHAAEKITRRFLEDEDFAKQYYIICIWSQQVLGQNDFQWYSLFQHADMLKDKFTSGFTEMNWWRARHYVILAYATSRYDLIQDVGEINELYDSFFIWYEWLMENHERLLARDDFPVWSLGQNLMEEPNKLVLTDDFLKKHLNIDNLPSPEIFVISQLEQFIIIYEKHKNTLNE